MRSTETHQNNYFYQVIIMINLNKMACFHEWKWVCNYLTITNSHIVEVDIILSHVSHVLIIVLLQSPILVAICDVSYTSVYLRTHFTLKLVEASQMTHQACLVLDLRCVWNTEFVRHNFSSNYHIICV